MRMNVTPVPRYILRAATGLDLFQSTNDLRFRVFATLIVLPLSLTQNLEVVPAGNGETGTKQTVRAVNLGPSPEPLMSQILGYSIPRHLLNAGHLPPYLNEKPMEIEGSLPLGILDRLDCSLLQFRMSPSDRLLALSDGVAEATNDQGNHP
jgi:hypothetical protein